jgi:hypothetical protein
MVAWGIGWGYGGQDVLAAPFGPPVLSACSASVTVGASSLHGGHGDACQRECVLGRRRALRGCIEAQSCGVYRRPASGGCLRAWRGWAVRCRSELDTCDGAMERNSPSTPALRCGVPFYLCCSTCGHTQPAPAHTHIRAFALRQRRAEGAPRWSRAVPRGAASRTPARRARLLPHAVCHPRPSTPPHGCVCPCCEDAMVGRRRVWPVCPWIRRVARSNPPLCGARAGHKTPLSLLGFG